MRLLSASLLSLICVRHAAAQSFLSVISSYPQLSNFTSFYLDNFPLATLLLTNSSTEPRTVLVPNNDAFASYERYHGYSVTSLPPTDLESLIRYHTLVGYLTTKNFSEPRGLTAPSLLEGEQYNNRSAGAALESKFGEATYVRGQVVFISAESRPGGNRFLVRQVGPASAIVKSGGGSELNLIPLDAAWDGGYVQEVDQ
jgi:uncharacterized surface protein with fasciclin (FAS1) repeats